MMNVPCDVVGCGQAAIWTAIVPDRSEMEECLCDACYIRLQGRHPLAVANYAQRATAPLKKKTTPIYGASPTF